MVPGKLTALRLGLCCGSNAAHPKSVYAHTRYRTYTQNAALPFALCCQRFQPVLGCGGCRDAFPFPSLAVGHEEVGVIFGGENCVCPARSRRPQFLLPIALISLAGAVQSPQEMKAPVDRLVLLCERGRSSQQLLGSGCTLTPLWEKHCGFSAALQEANLSEYRLRLRNFWSAPLLEGFSAASCEACCFAEHWEQTLTL